MIVFTILVTVESIIHEDCYCYIRIIDGDGTKQQNCSMVVAILDAAIKHFKTAHRHITTLYAKSDNATNLKNEMLIKFLSGLCVRSDPQNLDEEPLKCKGMSPSQPQDGKDLADLGVALANAKIQKVVDGGFSIDNPRCQALALVEGDGLANCIVMLGDLVDHQLPIKNKKLPTTCCTNLLSLSKSGLERSGGAVSCAALPYFLGEGCSGVCCFCVVLWLYLSSCFCVYPGILASTYPFS